jgi:hypothetical protein
MPHTKHRTAPNQLARASKCFYDVWFLTFPPFVQFLAVMLQVAEELDLSHV